MHDIITEIWQTARRNKLRTTLTGFAVAWGIFMIIVLLGAGNGLINANVKQASSWLTNSMEAYGGYTSKAYKGLTEGRGIELNSQDLAATETEFPETVDAVGAVYYHSATVSHGDQYLSSMQIVGVYPLHSEILKRDLICGRHINDVDLKEKRKVLVLADNQAKELDSKDCKRLLGKQVKVGDIAFKVVGIYKSTSDGESSAYASYSTVKSLFGTNDNSIGNIEFTFHGLKTEEANDAFEKVYRRRLNANHMAHPDDERAIWIWNGYTQNLQMETGIGIIRTALWVVGLFTLLSGIVGVSNIMLITVKERTHEFGIRKAIGAKPWSIMKLIVAESITITAFFGYLGMVAGMLACFLMDKTLGQSSMEVFGESIRLLVNPTVGIDVAIEATLVLIIAGTLAGLAPARKAAKVRPIEALRDE